MVPCLVTPFLKKVGIALGISKYLVHRVIIKIFTAGPDRILKRFCRVRFRQRTNVGES